MTEPVIYEPFSVSFFPETGQSLLKIPEAERQIAARDTWFRLSTGNWQVAMTTVSWEVVILQMSRRNVSGWDNLLTLRGSGNNITVTSEMVSISTGGDTVDVRPIFNSAPSATAVSRRYPVTLEFYPIPTFNGDQPT